jgi:hypothetical protein
MLAVALYTKPDPDNDAQHPCEAHEETNALREHSLPRWHGRIIYRYLRACRTLCARHTTPRQVFVIQLAEARAEWLRRHVKTI